MSYQNPGLFSLSILSCHHFEKIEIIIHSISRKRVLIAIDSIKIHFTATAMTSTYLRAYLHKNHFGSQYVLELSKLINCMKKNSRIQGGSR